MSLDILIKLLSAAKLPLSIAGMGLLLNLGGSNEFLKNTGATAALLASGTATATILRKDKHLQEIQQLERRASANAATLKRRIDDAENRAATATRKFAKASANTERLRGSINALQSQIATLRREQKSERERFESEVLSIGANLNTAAAAVTACQSDNSLLAGKLHALEMERTELIAELYETAVEEVAIAQNIAVMEKQFHQDSAYQVTQKKKAKSEMVKARANYHTEIAEAHSRIEELESKLAEKTKVAQQMLQELQGDANGSFTHLSGKANAQDEIIAGLKAQIDELRKTNKAITLQRFDTVGTDNTHGNRLIDALAKRGCIYGAHHNERTSNNGRLQVWLKMIDAPLKRAQDALDDIEAELNLWAKPSVKVDRGMHLFTLSTEQEHKVLAAPQVPLSRLEKTLNSAIHARIVGGSGSGKTVLLNNLMHYMAASIKGANVTLLDPKAVDDWGHFTPKYWGEECVTGIVELANGLKWRVADTVRHRKAGKPAPSYDPELFIVDEAQYNYLLAQNADDSHVKERGEQAPNYAKKAKGALAGLLSLGRAYNAIGLFVTQLPQVSKVGLNEGSFDPCVNIFLGVQIDNAIDAFLPGSGYSETKCKALSKELSIRRKLGQQWVMLVADLPRTEAYLMECPAPGYYQTRFSGEIGEAAKPAGTAENQQLVDSTALQTGSEPASCEPSAGERQEPAGKTAGDKQPSAHCPKCSHLSSKYHGTKPKPNGKYRFICENSECEKGAKKGTFSALPLA